MSLCVCAKNHAVCLCQGAMGLTVPYCFDWLFSERFSQYEKSWPVHSQKEAKNTDPCVSMSGV